jgi:putative tricarboxylic transport membrane protein
VRLKLANAQDFWCGVFFVALGALAMYLARDYAMGDALSMGPGYFPMWLGGIMICLGVAIASFAFVRELPESEAAEFRDWGLRPWLVLPASLAAYAMLMDADAGFAPSLFVLIIGCALAHKDVRWRETLLLAVVVTAAAVAIFSYGIGMPYPLFWWGY